MDYYVSTDDSLGVQVDAATPADAANEARRSGRVPASAALTVRWDVKKTPGTSGWWFARSQDFEGTGATSAPAAKPEAKPAPEAKPEAKPAPEAKPEAAAKSVSEADKAAPKADKK